MKHIISIAVLAALCTGCAAGINHNVVTIDGKQYLAETPTYVSPVLPITEWSGETTYKEVALPDSHESIYEKQPSDIKKSTKEILQAILDNCQQAHPRDSYKVKKCIQNEINLL